MCWRVTRRNQGNIFRPSDLSLHPNAPQEPVRNGALQCTGMSNEATTNTRMPEAVRCSRMNLVDHEPLNPFSNLLIASFAAGQIGTVPLLQLSRTS